MLRLHTLGRLQLLRGDAASAEVIAVQDKRLAVLAFLALGSAAGPLRRDTMLGVFWPELDQADARRALRQSLYHLRNVVGEDVILGEGDEVALAPDRLWCDAVRLERGATPAEVLELYQGDFLPGVYTTGISPTFEEWLDRTRTRLRRRAVEAAWATADAAASAGELSAALMAARRAVELTPDDEAGIRRLMALLDTLGDRAGALATHRDFAQRLRTQYGATPSPETEALAAAIRERRGLAPSQASPAAAAVVEATSVTLDRPDAAPPAATRPPAVPTRRWRLGVLALAAGIALVAVLRTRSPSLRASGFWAEHDRLVVADFIDQARDPELAAAVTTLVRVDLGRSELPVFGDRQVKDALQRMGVAGIPSPDQVRELATRMGARAIVQGAVARLGSGFALTSEVVAPESGEVLLAVTETARDSTQLIPAVERLARALRARIGEPLQAARGRPPLEQVTTPSLAALRAYSSAERQKRVGQDRQRELQLLQQAIAADSGFAAAWLGLANLYYTTGQIDLAREATRRAHAQRERLPPRDRLYAEVAYQEYVARDMRRAADAYLALLERDSTDFRMLHNLALTWQALHDYQRQVEYERRALRWSDSSYSVIWLGLLQGLVNAGRLDTARATVAAARARFPDDRYLDWIDGYIAQNDGDLAAVDRVGRLLAGASTGVDHVLEGNRLLADLHELRGRAELAAEYRRRAIAAAAADRRDAAVVEDLARLARVEAPDAPASRFAAGLARHGIDTLPEVARPFDALQLGWLGLGLRGRAASEVARARAAGVEPGAVVAALLSADSARARGETASAVAALRRAQAADECPICRLPQLAEAYLTAEMTDSAIATYRRYLETPYVHRLASDAVQLETVLGELARLYEDEGQPERAEPLLQRAATLRGEALPTR